MIKRREFVRHTVAGLGGLAICPGLLARAGQGSYAGREHRELHVIDGLCIPLRMGQDQPLSEEVLNAILASGLTAVNMTTPRPGYDYGETSLVINKLNNIIKANNEVLTLVRGTRDLDHCRDTGSLGIIIGFQSTEMFDEDLKAVTAFHQAGLRIAQMSYNGPGVFGHGCLSEQDAGLTPAGEKAIALFNQLGTLIDLSHGNQPTTAQAIELSEAPLVISHTGCNSIYQHPRNNDDAELRAVADKGGVVGIYLMPFLDGGSGELTVDMLFAHLDHVIDICGAEHVGIGSDQGVVPVNDGPEYRARLRAEVMQRRAAGISAPGESPDRPPFIPALNRSDRLLAIADLMAERGYGDSVIKGVIGGNFYRVMREAWG